MFRKELNKNKLYLLLCLSLFSLTSLAQDCDNITYEGISNPGVYNVATLTESDGLRDGPGYAGATIYYPTDATPPFAGIAIVPGYLSPEFTIQEWGPFYASHGIVAMTIGTNSIFDDPYLRKDALLDAIITLTEENTRPDSPLLGKLDTDKFAVSGWSMGGGGAQLAATADPTLKAVVALCPWLDETQTTSSDINHSIPVLIFSGEFDAVAPVESNANVHYDYTLETTDKLIYEVENGDHFVANGPDGGEGDVGKMALSWLQYYLEGDNCYCPLFLNAPSTASNFMTNVVCPGANSIDNDFKIESNFSYSLFPNPCEKVINLKIDNIGANVSYEVVSVIGEKIVDGLVSNNLTSVNTQKLKPGIYYIIVHSDHFTQKTKFIVL